MVSRAREVASQEILPKFVLRLYSGGTSSHIRCIDVTATSSHLNRGDSEAYAFLATLVENDAETIPLIGRIHFSAVQCT